jgi:serine/threonine-protein kinase
MHELIGQSLGRYHITEKLGEGGMATVYKAYDTRLERDVAIKIILASLARNETYMALFEREALILEELAHEAIVRYQLYAVDQTTGRPCLVMQFVPGPSLKERMEQGPMTAGDIRLLTKRLASGLAAAHNHDYKVYHRDLSPDNVILEDGRVEKAKLIDFGIAKGGAQSAEKSIFYFCTISCCNCFS